MSGTYTTNTSHTPSPVLRLAGICAVLLGLSLIFALPVLTRGAAYLGLLAGLLALVALVSGTWLQIRDDLLARLNAVTVAVVVGAAGLLDVTRGLPGARGIEEPSPTIGLVVSGLTLAVVALLVVEASVRKPEGDPDHPYAL